MVKFEFVEENEASEPQAYEIENIDFKDISKPNNITPIVKDTTKGKNGFKTPNKAKILEDLEYILDNSGYKVIIELDDKTPTRLKSGILQANKIKGYSNMTNDELDNQISKLIANNILKTLKGD